VKKTAALLLAGLVMTPASFAGEKSKAHPVLTAPTTTTEQPVSPKAPSGDDYVTLNFTNIDINALIKVMSELTRRNFILDERVTGKVTLMTPTRISPDEAYQVFLSALEIKGFAAVEDGKIIRIIPVASARQSGIKVFLDDNMKGEGFVTKLLRLSYINPQEIVRTLTQLMTKDGAMIAYPATNSVIITDSVHNIKKMETLIRALDVPAPDGKGKINVYYLKYGNADEFLKVLTSIVSRIPVPTPGQMPVTGGPVSILEGAVTVTADKVTNSLIIVSSPSDYETVKDVIQKLDIRRRQVYVETAIVEMSLTKMRDLGFEFLTVPQQIQSGPGAPITPIGGTNFGRIGAVAAGGPAALASMSGLGVGAIKGTFTYNNQTYLNIGALLHALQSDGNVNVLSTPNIVTMDNQKAEIMVGQNVPFITGQTQNATTGAGTLFNTIDRRDVGIKLTLTPQISSEETVRLDVNQEISDVIATSTANAAGPTTSKRSASTTVVVKDRQTMVIGGLIRDNLVSSESKVPFLGDIPFLGWFFKSKTTSMEKTNLMIFITPYILKNEGDADELTTRKNEMLEDFRKENRIDKKGSEPATSSDNSTEKKSVIEKRTAEPAPVLAPSGAGKTDTDGKIVVLPSASSGKTDPKNIGPEKNSSDAVVPLPLPAEKAPAEGPR